MLKFLFALSQILAANSDLISFASHFNIKLNKSCSRTNEALEAITKITIDCGLFDTIELIGCINDSVSYLKENTSRLQKCLDRDSFYEFGNLLNSFEEDQYCIIFHTALFLNENLKSSKSIQVIKEIVFNEYLVNEFEKSCSIHSMKASKKITDFFVKMLKPADIKSVVKIWADYFDEIQNNSDGTIQFQPLLEEPKGKSQKNNKKTKEQSSDKDLIKDEFWNKLYCALNDINSDSVFIKFIWKMLFNNNKVYQHRDIEYYLNKFYKVQDKVDIDCSKYNYDINFFSLRFIFLVSNNAKESLNEENLSWALGMSSNEKNDNYFSKFCKKLEEIYNASFYYVKKGFYATYDILSYILTSLG